MVATSEALANDAASIAIEPGVISEVDAQHFLERWTLQDVYR